MKELKSKLAVPAEEVAAAKSSLNSDEFDVHPLAAEEFAQIVREAEKGSMTEPMLAELHSDHQRAISKRKKAQMGGEVIEAASASAREQAILALQYPFAVSGVRSRQGQKAGARGAAKVAQAKGEDTARRVLELADQYLRESNYGKRDIAGVIARKLSMSSRQVRKHLTSHASGLWKKKGKQP